MGILDDAIREHLELKRRGGADPGELSRLEREAFGAGETPSQAPPAADGEPEPADEPEPAGEVERFVPEAALPEPEPEPVAEPEPPAAAPPLDQPTRQFTVEELEEAERRHEPAAEPEPAERGEHDELEDTPEFLQETPEHDRLWFEQKPPKDFDF
jgi:hypothetical protein